MREKTVEQKLVKAVKAAGGICPKWTAPGFDGLPDRIVLLPGGRMGFCGSKGSGEEKQGHCRSPGISCCGLWVPGVCAG